jgi:hypothetical protein
MPKKQTNKSPKVTVKKSDVRGGTGTLAAKAAGVSRKSAYEHYRTQPEFAAEWEDSLNAAIEMLEAEVWQRAKKRSDLLAIFLLKAHKPERYQERYQQANLNLNLNELTDDQLERIAAGEHPASVLASAKRS